VAIKAGEEEAYAASAPSCCGSAARPSVLTWPGGSKAARLSACSHQASDSRGGMAAIINMAWLAAAK